MIETKEELMVAVLSGEPIYLKSYDQLVEFDLLTNESKIVYHPEKNFSSEVFVNIRPSISNQILIYAWTEDDGDEFFRQFQYQYTPESQCWNKLSEPWRSIVRQKCQESKQRLLAQQGE